MCLALLALATHPKFAVVIAANRDEYHSRPAAPAQWWDEGWLAGRDLTAGGTWLGVARTGRWALVTNVREVTGNDPNAPSRGQLVLGFLQSDASAVDAMRAIVEPAHRYNGFNLLGGDCESAAWGSNRGPAAQSLAAGVYGLSNQQLDTPWPKIRRSKEALARWCAASHPPHGWIEGLFDILSDRTIAADSDLPDTGVGTERERMLSPAFIVSPAYGTRNSTVITIDHDGNVHWRERAFDARGEMSGEADVDFSIRAQSAKIAAGQ